MPAATGVQFSGTGPAACRHTHRTSEMATTNTVRHDRPIALFSAYYPTHLGGMELACAELARGIVLAGKRLEWVAMADGGAAHDLSAHCKPLAGSDIVYRLTGVPLPLPMPWTVLQMSRIAKRAGVVVIAEANFVLCVAAFVIAKWNRKPVLLIQHVGKPSTVSKLARLVMRLGEKLAVRPMVRNADLVVCVSPVVARHFAGERTRSPCITIGLGVDIDCFRFAASTAEQAADRQALGLRDDGKVACFVGRLTGSKGIMVIAGMARLRPEWTFAVAGIGPVDPDQWNLPNVVSLGQLDRDGVARLYRASDVMVLPSQSESFSLVVREALACGSRVLCSDQIVDTDPGLAAFLATEAVDLSNVAATARRFADALDRPVGTTRQDARDYIARQCSWPAVSAQYVVLIDQLVARSGAGGSAVTP
jgi:glycosyltransferase involved in cell wall biosynthesis